MPQPSNVVTLPSLDKKVISLTGQHPSQMPTGQREPEAQEAFSDHLC